MIDPEDDALTSDESVKSIRQLIPGQVKTKYAMQFKLGLDQSVLKSALETI